MKTNIFPAIRLTLVCLVFFSGIYTCVVLGIAQLAPNSGKGAMISQGGKSYYANIGQDFNEDRYFWSRPSAVGYNAEGSCGSNKGPNNADYLAEVRERIDTFMVHNPSIKKSDIPADIVTASGSGLDPHISVAGATVQIQRIARLRNIPIQKLEQLVSEATELPLFGIFGPSKVNVLRLNLSLDLMQEQD